MKARPAQALIDPNGDAQRGVVVWPWVVLAECSGETHRQSARTSKRPGKRPPIGNDRASDSFQIGNFEKDCR